MSTSCSRRVKDDDIVLVTESLMGSVAHLATFNGNSVSPIDDCESIAKDLSQKYSRDYKCRTFSTVKKDIKY